MVINGAARMLIDKSFVAVANRLSVTLKVMVVGTPAKVGVPVILPLVAFKLNPEGNVPLWIDHTKGKVPPEAVRFCE